MICPHCGHEIPPHDYAAPDRTVSPQPIFIPFDTTCAAQPIVHPIISQDFRINLAGCAGAAQPIVTMIKL